MIAIGGDSGSGKTTLCNGFERIFGSNRIETIELESYHSLDRAQRRAVGFSALNPRATNFAAMEEDLWALREGRGIDQPTYDHSDGTFGEIRHVEPTELILVSGLFPLYTRAMRSLFDVSVWLAPQPELKSAWKLQRDTQERGYTPEQVRAEVDEGRVALDKYVQPQARYADLTLTFYRSGDDSGVDDTRLSARIRKGGRLRPLEYAEFESPATSINRLESGDGGYPETVIEIAGGAPSAVAQAVEHKIWSHVDAHAHALADGIGSFTDASGRPAHSHALAIAELLIARRVVLIERDLLEMVP
jgi:phosphoribulokinase